jgi:cystathionine beta-synthase
MNAEKRVFETILDAIGHTPIVKLNRIGRDMDHQFYVKVEATNPGASVKDRLALQLVKDAVDEGKLKPGGTIIETTSGNTGMGLAMIGAVQGFQCLFCMPDKVSDEKIKALQAFGAKVVMCPTAVEPDDPRSYYSVAKKLAGEVPNSFYVDQYHNASNPKAHYLMTGPEIYEQMGDQLDYLVAGIGTGGTLCGSAKFIKEHNASMQAIGVDPVGSIYYEYFKTGNIPKVVTSYKVEGFGEDFMPTTIDFDYIDEVVQVDDQESFDMARRLVKEEGLFVGGSCGSAVQGMLKHAQTVPGKKTFLAILPDSGSRYLSKVYDDQWMVDNGFRVEAQR